jgi:hypothetical protein
MIHQNSGRVSAEIYKYDRNQDRPAEAECYRLLPGWWVNLWKCLEALISTVLGDVVISHIPLQNTSNQLKYADEDVSLHIITEPPSDRSSFLQTPLGSMRMALSCWLCNAMAVRGVISYASGGLLSGRTMKYYERPSAKGTANAGRSFHAYDDISGYRSICAIVRFLGISNS